MYKFLFLFIVTLISGCAARQRESNHLADLLHTHPPQLVLNKLQETVPAPRDQLQFHLNLGFLQLITGDFQNAIATLSLAKQEMLLLAASSISENLGAGTINETLRSYSGYPTDRVMVHNMLALSYLFNNNIDGARVEMLQADLAMKKLAGLKGEHGQLASAHLLAGIIYELLDEQSNALISYRYAAEIIEKRGLSLPLGLKQALLRMSFELGAESQYLAFQKQFPGSPLPSGGINKQLFALYFDGIVSHKMQNSIMVPGHDFEQLIRISMPVYPQLNKPISCAKIIQDKSQAITEVVDDLEVMVREDLENEYPSILLLTTTRAVAKYEVVRKSRKQDPLLGVLANIAAVLTEEADLRSWNMLPSNIQFVYLEPQENEIIIDSCNNSSQKIAIANGSKNVFLVNSLSNTIFHYQQ